MRTEKDSLGEIQIPDEAYYGVHTARSLGHFGLSGEAMPMEIILAIVKLKWACAKVNSTLNLLPAEKRKAIATACQRVLGGEFDSQFPLDVFQAGSGTSTNMNVNEVIANIANEILGGKKGDRGLVHPNDDVNMGQSTNNVFPSAIKMAALELSQKMLAALRKVIAEMRKKEGEMAEVFKSGRTHLQDAVPITLGQEFSAYARALEKDLKRVEHARAKLRELGAGGNAIGTGVNTKKEFRPMLIRELSTLAGEAFESAENGIEVTQFLTDLAEMSGSLRLLSLDLQKICNDLRLMASGPNAGLNEIMLPAVEPGSSIMPGKVNPSICEAVNMVCLQVMGNDYCIAMACGLGQLELNTHMPVIGLNLVKSIRLLTRACELLAEKCLAGITANREICGRYLEQSAGMAAILNPKLGYDRVAELVKESLKTRKSMRELIVEKKIMSGQEFEDLLHRAIGPNL
ncbi:MAG: aspartate ammonia-lyase [Lentisphaerota bacterium]